MPGAVGWSYPRGRRRGASPGGSSPGFAPKLLGEAVQLEFHQLDMRYERLGIADPGRHARLVSALLSEGQRSPVLVVASCTPQRYVLIDGYRRVLALRQLGCDTVEAVLLDTDELDALVLGHRLERTRRRTALEDGWFVHELVTGHGLEQCEVARRLECSTSWVSRRLSLVTVLPDSAQEAVRDGTVPAYAATKYLVPLARANREHCEGLVAGLGGRPVSSRQMQRLYEGWRRAGHKARERIVSEPWLFLRAADAMVESRPEVAGAAVEALLRELEALAGISGRARRRIADGLFDEVDAADKRSVRRVFEQAELAYSALSELLYTELPDAGPGDAHGDLEAA